MLEGVFWFLVFLQRDLIRRTTPNPPKKYSDNSGDASEVRIFLREKGTTVTRLCYELNWWAWEMAESATKRTTTDLNWQLQ